MDQKKLYIPWELNLPRFIPPLELRFRPNEIIGLDTSFGKDSFGKDRRAIILVNPQELLRDYQSSGLNFLYSPEGYSTKRWNFSLKTPTAYIFRPERVLKVSAKNINLASLINPNPHLVLDILVGEAEVRSSFIDGIGGRNKMVDNLPMLEKAFSVLKWSGRIHQFFYLGKAA